MIPMCVVFKQRVKQLFCAAVDFELITISVHTKAYGASHYIHNRGQCHHDAWYLHTYESMYMILSVPPNLFEYVTAIRG